MNEHEKELWEELKAQAHPLNGLCEYISFVSVSNGKGKRRRKRWREVELLKYRGKIFTLNSRMTRELEWVMKDIFPESAIPHNYGNDWYGAFLHALRTMPKKRKKNRKCGKSTLHHN